MAHETGFPVTVSGIDRSRWQSGTGQAAHRGDVTLDLRLASKAYPTVASCAPWVWRTQSYKFFRTLTPDLSGNLVYAVSSRQSDKFLAILVAELFHFAVGVARPAYCQYD